MSDPSGLLPVGRVDAGSWHDKVRVSLRYVSFPAHSAHKAFVRKVCEGSVDRVTPGQWAQIMRLAYRCRKQLRDELVPPADAVKRLDRWVPRPPVQLETVPDRPPSKAALRRARREARRAAQLDLVAYIEAMQPGAGGQGAGLTP